MLAPGPQPWCVHICSTCKPLYNLIAADPNSLLWRTAWSATACHDEQVPAAHARDRHAPLWCFKTWSILHVLTRGCHCTGQTR